MSEKRMAAAFGAASRMKVARGVYVRRWRFEFRHGGRLLTFDHL
jgi:hypothetical protein